MDRHLDGCSECSANLSAEGEVVSRLAYAVPQLQAPPRVKERLMARIDAETEQPVAIPARRPRLGLFATLRRGLAAHYGMAVAAMMAVAVVAGGIWFNDRLNRMAEEREALAAQVQMVAEGETRMQELVRNLSIIGDNPDTKVKRLSGTPWSSASYGTMVGSDPGTVALLSVADLPQLFPGQEYQVWLVKDGLAYSSGVLPVDPNGHGQMIVRLPRPLREFDRIIITLEHAGSIDANGTSVLRGDL
jgi:hypothetical protein